MPQIHTPATRERILVFLQENRSVSVQALSRAWGLTRADIRYHLNELVEEGLLEMIPNKPSKRGRPEQIYRLTARNTPNNLVDLCEALLDLTMQLMTKDARDQFLKTLAAQLTSTEKPPENATQRLNQAIAYMDMHGYQARWEAHADGPRILFRNCPYGTILEQHPELCLLDKHLLERLVGVTLQQSTKMNLETGKPPACIFITCQQR